LFQDDVGALAGAIVPNVGAVEVSVMKSFYRITKFNPPTDADYQTRFDREGPAPENLPPQVRESWDALSAFDTSDGAIATARRFKRLGRYICRYEIPNAGVSSGIRRFLSVTTVCGVQAKSSSGTWSNA
jgi:hypothetical protein